MDQWLVFAVLAGALVCFIWGRWRYDLVALSALLVLCLLDVIPVEKSFLGFGHPAVITVAAVLVISRAMQNTGVVEWIAGFIVAAELRAAMQIATLTGLVAVLSAFMNNVGALALLMPVTIRMARAAEKPPSIFLMPLAFGSLLGGMTTLIGTPPNIIVATIRGEAIGEPFGMFDFAWVGVGAALAGVLFIGLGGWRLIPRRAGQASEEQLFEIADYVAEVRLKDDSPFQDKAIREVAEAIEDEVMILGLIRGEKRIAAPSHFERIQKGDLLLVSADAEALNSLCSKCKMELVGGYEFSKEDLGTDTVRLVEAVIMPGSRLIGRELRMLQLGWRYGASVLAVARQGSRIKSRVTKTRPREGDVLLMQLVEEDMQEALEAMGCLPLAERGLRLARPRRIVASVGLFAAGMAAATAGWLPVQISLACVAVLMIFFNFVSLRESYEEIDWPVIVLLAAMIPVGEAMEATGGAARIAGLLLNAASSLPPYVVLLFLLVVTMTLSDVVNNAASALLMAPIGIAIANGMGASIDPFLIIVGIGSSCAFLTPIGHQSNTLILGPGGFRFSDYWRLGLPVSILVIASSLPLTMYFWPLYP